MSKDDPREYGEGSIYQRCEARRGCPALVPGPPHPKTGKPTKVRPDHKCKGLWVGTLEAGWTAKSKRRRIPVYGKTKDEVRRKLRNRKDEIARAGRGAVVGSRVTVKAWADKWLELITKDTEPNTYAAHRTQTRRWIVPTIGTKFLGDLTPADVRAVAAASRAAGNKSSTALRAHATLSKMLKDAAVEGHVIPPNLFTVKAPSKGTSDRTDIPLPQALSILSKTLELPDGGARSVVALMQALRQGEALGLEIEALDFKRHMMTVEWQLQPLSYNVRYDRSSGFRIPDEYEARHLVGRFHLVRPKSRSGLRIMPMVKWTENTLKAWLEKAPDNPHGLVWARLEQEDMTPRARKAVGWPIDPSADLQQWHDLQKAAGVHHPGGRFYHLHETRHTTATLLLEAEVPEEVIVQILGHSSFLSSKAYLHANTEQVLAALEKVEQRLKALPAPPG